MNIKINNIANRFAFNTLKNTEQSEIKSVEKSDESLPNIMYTDLVFKSRHLKLVRPEFKSALEEKLAQKVTFYLEKFPEMSKMSKPVLINFEDKQLEFFVDKTKKAVTEVDIKLLNNNENPNYGIKMLINDKGQMINGFCYSPDRMCILFERIGRNVRRIQYGNTFYKPISEDSLMWQQLVLNKNDFVYYTAAKNMDFRDTDFQTFFMELARKDTSLLLK